jgi:hypothetical protein
MDPLKPPSLALHLALARDRRLTRSSPVMDGVATYPNCLKKPDRLLLYAVSESFKRNRH